MTAKARLAMCLTIGLGVAPRAAHAAPDIQFLGPAREISHTSSASRDTAVPGMVVVPHRILTGGADFSLLSVRAPGATFRLGFFGMLELESDGETNSLFPFPNADIRFWRGLFGASLAVASDRLGQRWCPGCTWEATLSGRHESEHYTGGNNGGPGTFYGDHRAVGNFLMPDVAVRIPVGKLTFIARLQDKVFLPGAAFTDAPGGDLEVRWRSWERVNLFLSSFAEYLFGADQLPDAHLVRTLGGVVLPSTNGDLYLFVGSSIGNRKGLPSYTQERTLEFGVRAGFF